jgi:hypothetical protein
VRLSRVVRFWSDGMYSARFGFSAFLICCATPALAQQVQESPKDVIAAHLRLQGYACETPKSARRDVKASRPDEAVWLITCENARYRVRLVPNMADVVEAF